MFNLHTFATAITVAILAVTPISAWARAQDYRFELAEAPVTSGKNAIIKVRLIHVPDAKPVSDAVIFQKRIDMGPEGMATMDAPIKALPAAEPGIYQFQAEHQMGGKWALTLSAKVQGEAETVKGTVTLDIPK